MRDAAREPLKPGIISTAAVTPLMTLNDILNRFQRHDQSSPCTACTMTQISGGQFDMRNVANFCKRACERNGALAAAAEDKAGTLVTTSRSKSITRYIV